MKNKSKKSTVLNAVLFLFVMGATFGIGWFLIPSRDEANREGVALDENIMASEETEPTFDRFVENSRREEEWAFIQDWLANHEVQFNENRIPGDMSHLEMIRNEIGVGTYEAGVGGFAGETDDLTVSWELETPQDRLNIRVSNTTSAYYPVLLKVFYNYEAVDFRLAGSDVYQNELLIDLPPGYEYIIPFHLDSSLEAHEGLSKLTLAAFFDPQEYSVFHGAGHDLSSTVLNFEINYGLDGPMQLERVQHAFEERSDFSRDTTPLITLEQPGGITSEYFLGPGRPRQASPGELLEIEVLLNVRGDSWHSNTGEGNEVEDFLVMGLLDFNQVELSGQPFLWSVNSAVPLFGKFTIEAPMEPGLYDFIALVIENPTGGVTFDNFIPIETSTRFTIEVVDEG